MMEEEKGRRIKRYGVIEEKLSEKEERLNRQKASIT